MRKADLFSVTVFVLIFITFILLVRTGIIQFMNEIHPYFLGFVQFIIFASIGELVSARIIYKKWIYGPALAYKALVWGIAGMCITFAFKLFALGTVEVIEAGYLPVFDNYDSTFNKLLIAFYISAINNIMFGPVINTCIRIFGNFIDRRVDNKMKLSLYDSIDMINWREFISFTIVKCIPLFWIPTNTILFLMSEYYRVSGAAILSMAFGIIMIVVKWKERN